MMDVVTLSVCFPFLEMVWRIEDELEDRREWCLALSRIMPSLEDLHHAVRLRDVRKVNLNLLAVVLNCQTIYK